MVPGLLLPCSVPRQQSPSLPSAPNPAAAPGCSWEWLTPAGIPLLLHALAAQQPALPGVQGDGVWEICQGDLAPTGTPHSKES